MKCIKNIVFMMYLGFNLISCATKNSESLVKIIGENEAEVIIDGLALDFVKSGDKVYFYLTECNMPMNSKYRRCYGTKVSDGFVVERKGEIARVKSNKSVKLSTEHYVSWVYSKK